MEAVEKKRDTFNKHLEGKRTFLWHVTIHNKREGNAKLTLGFLEGLGWGPLEGKARLGR